MHPNKYFKKGTSTIAMLSKKK